ncbi:MAG: methionyl-tRNA formyltransferase [Candidatus Saccharimonadaceae bacterium]
MTHISKTIVFFGTDEFSAVSLRELIAKGFTIAAVVTKPDSKKGRGRELSKSTVKEIAEANNITVWQPLKVSEIIEDVKKLDTPMGVLVSYGKIIPQSVIDLFTPGIVNVHPSLLPLYRGPSPIESAILNGDTETGVTIMQLSAGMDAGPIYSQVTVLLNDTETLPELEPQLAELGAQQLSVTLPAIINEAITPTPQNDDVATYCKLLSKEASFLDTAALTAEQAERQVRAYLAFPKTKTLINGQQIVITKAHVTSIASSPLDIKCSDDRYLAVDELIGPSGKPMNAASFINGYLGKT